MQEADRAALAMALGMATDWVCRYARELGTSKDDKDPDYSVIASFASCHGEEQLRRFEELLKDAAVHAPDMQAEGLHILTTLRRLLERCSLAPPLKR
jgi:hypothetical protein